MSQATRTAPPGLERALERATGRLERNGLVPAGRIKLSGLTAAEIAGLSGLLGPRWRSVLPGRATSVDLRALDEALRASRAYPDGLVAACAATKGAPLVDRRAERQGARDARHEAWCALEGHPALARHPALACWLERERTSGAAMRTGDGFALLCSALDVLDVLPVDPPQTLARFASARCGGDPHALDASEPLDGAVRRALAHLDDEPHAGGAEARRGRYDRWGVVCDELSSTVLCINVWPGATEPRVLTLRELRGVERLAVGGVVFTCENPDVVTAAADELGTACAPLICTNGWPSAACLRLLRAVIAGGATARHHGDMDHEGLRILDRLVSVTQGRLWRMTAGDYARHAAGGRPLAARALSSLKAPTLVDLSATMATTGRAVQEEQTTAELVADLRRAGL